MEFTCGLLSEYVHRRLDVPERDLQFPAAQTDVLLNEVLPPHHADQEETDGERPTVDVDTHRRPRRLAEQDVRGEVRGGRVGSQGCRVAGLLRDLLRKMVTDKSFISFRYCEHRNLSIYYTQSYF